MNHVLRAAHLAGLGMWDFQIRLAVGNNNDTPGDDVTAGLQEIFFRRDRMRVLEESESETKKHKRDTRREGMSKVLNCQQGHMM